MATNSTTSLKLDPEMKERVQRLAASQRRTAHWIMREAIEQYVDREEKREQFRLDTLASWEDFKTTGLHLTDEEVEAWLRTIEAGEMEAKLPECHV
jgi:predicted transcriptional regulator